MVAITPDYLTLTVPVRLLYGQPQRSGQGMTAQDDLSDVETATLGHFLESGFMAPALQALLPERREWLRV